MVLINILQNVLFANIKIKVIMHIILQKITYMV